VLSYFFTLLAAVAGLNIKQKLYIQLKLVFYLCIVYFLVTIGCYILNKIDSVKK
jgi:hypothetical protein